MILNILFVLLFSLLLVTLLVPVGGYRSYHSQTRRRKLAAKDRAPVPPGSDVALSMFFFFLLLFPLILAGHFWITPMGPTFMEVSWIPFVITGLLLAFLIAALSPKEPRPDAKTVDNPDDALAAGATAVFGLMFFLLFFTSVAISIAAIV